MRAILRASTGQKFGPGLGRYIEAEEVKGK
jgi:hypothetical protein